MQCFGSGGGSDVEFGRACGGGSEASGGGCLDGLRRGAHEDVAQEAQEAGGGHQHVPAVVEHPVVLRCCGSIRHSIDR